MAQNKLIKYLLSAKKKKKKKLSLLRKLVCKIKDQTIVTTVAAPH